MNLHVRAYAEGVSLTKQICTYDILRYIYIYINIFFLKKNKIKICLFSFVLLFKSPPAPSNTCILFNLFIYKYICM